MGDAGPARTLRRGLALAAFGLVGLLGVACGSAALPSATTATAKAAELAPAKPVAGRLPVNGLAMYYEVHGPETTAAPPLLLLHGGGSSIRTTFGEVLPKLAAHRRVVALEQQGHGHTADIDRPLSFEQMADDTAAALDRLGVAQVDVLGFSNGGSVAMQLAIRHPERVRRLVVGSAFYRNDGLVPPVRAMFQKPPRAADVPPPLREDYERVAPDPKGLQRLTEKLMAMLGGFHDWPDDALRGIAAPTLVLQADQDVARPEHALALCSLVPRCELVMLPGGHGTYLGEVTAARAGSRLPEATVAIVEDFLER